MTTRALQPEGAPLPDQPFVTAGQLARAAAVSKRTVHRRIAAGEIPAFRFGHELRIRREDAEHALKVAAKRPESDEWADQLYRLR